MKNFIALFCFTASSFNGFSQDSSYIFKIDKYLKLPDLPQIETPSYLKKYNALVPNKRIAAKGKNPFILPLDNMPCFVPDVSTIAKMPNQQAIGNAIPIPNTIILSK